MYHIIIFMQGVVGKVLGAEALIPSKLQKAMTYCNKKLTDLRSEERRRVMVIYIFILTCTLLFKNSYLVYNRAKPS